ncbi:hypothetical protein GCM10010168_44680 [Actinoplanes ianthinogenes]|uniref:Ferredoxin n=1 Tax=Actinoplanes ianthinogenes TaxID=122358 RepID=A0ABM7LPU4_9ACTN|nr:hypothetical protein [Actinoplanes ianthinogenes]BCJ41234.1 hypothetical protein Aiant_18910 [Actinoplanes ianthinogenes]GGR22011.1 hypothetical protein GCM10010168_44680 [Actinoplanes ianthinogenes]
MSRTERQQYLEGGLADLVCESCAALVRVRKSSPRQTSVQWSTAAVRQCATELGALVPTCPGLRASIDQAVRAGRLDVA